MMNIFSITMGLFGLLFYLQYLILVEMKESNYGRSTLRGSKSISNRSYPSPSVKTVDLTPIEIVMTADYITKEYTAFTSKVTANNLAVEGDLPATKAEFESKQFNEYIKVETQLSPEQQMELESRLHNKLNKQLFKQSLLVLMSVKIQNENDIAKEIQWIQEDYSSVCKFYSTCEWMVNVVAANDVLRISFEEATSKLPPNISITTSVSTETFNKYMFVQKFIRRMKDYDLVLLKDNDQRITSFSWRTFIEKRSNAIMSGPFRRSMNARCSERRQNFQLNEACNYESTTRPEWSSYVYDNVTPIDVPYLEQYFVLMDAKFANFFFNLALRPTLISRNNDWGPDYLWCAAAKVWDSNRPGCYLIPVVSDHEDTRQIEKNEEFNYSGQVSLRSYEADPILGRWMNASSIWRELIGGGKYLIEIERGCRRLFGLKRTKSVDFLQTCATKASRMNSIGTGDETLRIIVDELNKSEKIESNGDNTRMLIEAKKRLAESLHDLTKKLDHDYAKIEATKVEDATNEEHKQFFPTTVFTPHIERLLHFYENMNTITDNCRGHPFTPNLHISVESSTSVPHISTTSNGDVQLWYKNAFQRRLYYRGSHRFLPPGRLLLDVSSSDFDIVQACTFASSREKGLYSVFNFQDVKRWSDYQTYPQPLDWSERKTIPTFRGVGWGVAALKEGDLYLDKIQQELEDNLQSNVTSAKEVFLSKFINASSVSPDYGHHQRFSLVYFASLYPDLVSARLSSGLRTPDFIWEQNATNGLDVLLPFDPIPDDIYYTEYQVHIVMGGIGAAFRLSRTLHQGIAVILQEYPYTEWFTHAMVPFVHYIPLKQDLSNLNETLHWVRDNPYRVFDIAMNGKAFYDEYLSYDRMADFYHELLFRLMLNYGVET